MQCLFSKVGSALFQLRPDHLMSSYGNLSLTYSISSYFSHDQIQKKKKSEKIFGKTGKLESMSNPISNSFV